MKSRTDVVSPRRKLTVGMDIGVNLTHSPAATTSDTPAAREGKSSLILCNSQPLVAISSHFLGERRPVMVGEGASLWLRTSLVLLLFISSTSLHAQPISIQSINESNLLRALRQSEKQFNPHQPSKLDAQTAAIYRHLQQLSIDQRYEILEEYTFPKSVADEVHCFSQICGVDSPPSVFARLIGERPKPEIFATPRIGNLDAFFSSAWLLVSTAKELGKLHELKEQVDKRSGAKAASLNLLLSLAGTRGIDAESTQEFQESLMSELKNDVDAIAIEAVVVSAVAAQSESHSDLLHSIGIAMSQAEAAPPILRGLLREIQFNAKANPEIDAFQLNADWICVPARSRWYIHENYLTPYAAGPSRIMYRYPLSGDFRFEIEQLPSNKEDASTLRYNGTEVRWEQYRRVEVNQRAIDKHGETVRYWINGHPVRTAIATATAPWLSINSDGLTDGSLPRAEGSGFQDQQGKSFSAQNLFRNLKLLGAPTIPREVSLIGESAHAGWNSPFTNDKSTQWLVQDGVLRTKTGENTTESLLQYERPLLPNESIEYEFFASDEVMVHPALGRIAFLIQPDGVKVHWVTDGEREWTGLDPDNALVEPLFRRGPRPLPLTTGQWNRLLLKRGDDQITIRLNDTVIYDRPLNEIGGTRFGFFHDPSSERVQVRAATLRGDWPRTINSDSFLKPEDSSDASSLARLVGLFPEAIMRTNTRAVIAQAEHLDPKSRYEFLSNWVMPSPLRPTFRLTGHFDPESPSLRAHADLGNNLISPSLELISLAKELECLDDLGRQVEHCTVVFRDDQRARLAMLALIYSAQGKQVQAIHQLEAIFKLLQDSPRLHPEQYWPEVLVACMLCDQPNASDVLNDLLLAINPAAMNDTSEIARELLSLLQATQYRIMAQKAKHTPIELQNWAPTTSRNIVQKSGPSARWIASAGEIQAIGGSAIEQLFFKSPLVGNFEVQFDHELSNNIGCQVLVGGTSHQLIAGQIKEGPIDGPLKLIQIQPRVNTDRLALHQRYVVDNELCTVFASGRQVSQSPVQPEFPWLCIRQGYKQATRLLDVRVTGSPIIPDEVRLDRQELIGWRSYYHHDATHENSPWRYEEGEIIGQRSIKPVGSGDEQLLYYQRPLSEDGTVRYEYFYKPGESIVYPALDHTAFIIHGQSVGVHRVTLGPLDETFQDKVNVHVDPNSQRTASATLLRENEWNAIELSVRGDLLELKLNGESICVRPIEPTNKRTFGFFYYADQSSVRVKNVILRGEWPKQLPELVQQPLADQMVVQLDASRELLTAHFQHDFTKGLPGEYFALEGRQNATVSASQHGIKFDVASPDKWTQASMLFHPQMQGDFDVSVDFKDLTLDSGITAFARLCVQLTSPESLEGRVSRDEHGSGKRIVNAQLHSVDPNGAPVQANKQMSWESPAGTLRIARRGKKLHMLIKGDTGTQFRHVGSYDATDTPSEAIRLMTIAQRAQLSSVTWTSIEIHAQKLSLTSGDVGESRIFVARGDGSEMKQITQAIGYLGQHGSPDFSPDGNSIVFDTWMGTAATAHVFVVNADGTGLQDLGSGTMPTFSPDGKQIAFSSVDGMMLMNVDGSQRRVISRSGWGIQMSPSGNQVSFSDNDEKGPNLYAFDLQTNNKLPLLSGPLAQRYSKIYWNSDWSPDGQEICFSGDNRETGDRELAVVSVKGSDQTFEVLDTGDSFSNIAWHPDGQRITFFGRDPASRRSSVIVIKRNEPQFKELLLKDHGNQLMVASEWTRDGETMVIVGSPLANSTKQSIEGLHPIDLSLHVQMPASKFEAATEFPWPVAPRGERSIANIPTQIAGTIVLWGSTAAKYNRKYPEKVTDIACNQTFESLYILHGGFFPSEDEKPVFDVVLKYADGQQHSDSIVYANDLYDWFMNGDIESQTPTAKRSVLAWIADGKASGQDQRISFNMTEVSNPHPDKVVKSIELVSSKGETSGVVLAITAGKAGMMNAEAR